MECRERTSSERHAHLAAIADIVDRWQSGEITIIEKRHLIARENAFFHGQKRRSTRTGAMITAETVEHVHVPAERKPDEQDELWWQE